MDRRKVEPRISRGSGWIVQQGLFALVCLLAACGEGETQIQRPILDWDLPPDPAGLTDYLLDFEAVPVGATATRTVLIRNTGAAVLDLEAGWPEAPFFLADDDGKARVPVGGSYELVLGFKPQEGRATAEQALITIRTNEPGPASTRTVRLLGKGVLAGLDCEPTSLDLGRVLLGKTAQGSLRCVNRLEVALEVEIDELRGNHAASFTASFASHEGDSFPLAPQGEVEIELAFRAETVGRNDALLSLRDANGQPLAQIELVANVAATALQLVSEGCLDFGYTGVGEEERRTLYLENVGAAPVRILELRIPEEARPHFSALSQVPLEIPGGEGTHGIEVAFHPTAAGFRSTVLEIVTEQESGTAQLPACISGFGGGPKLVCDRDSMDFGQVAIGLPVVRSLRCRNDGYAPEGGSVDNLHLGALTSSLAAFQPLIRNPDGTAGARTQGYRIGEEFAVEITYAPTAEQVDAGTIRLESNAGSPKEFPILGEGRDLPPCVFSLLPRELRFGVLERGAELVQSFGIRNDQESACLVSDLRLGEGSDPAFSVEPIESAEIPGLGTLSVAVKFAPPEYRDRYEGKVVFQISSEEDRFQEVRLVGSSAQPCLIVRPGEMDFGRAMPGCETQDLPLTISNICGVPLTVTEIDVSDSLGSEQFGVRQRPILPFTLEPNRSAEFTMVYQPEEVGEDRGTVAITVQGLDDPYLGTLVGEGVASAVQTDDFVQPPQFKADILWVIDNSTSFATFQQLIADNLPAFLEHARGVDYRMAVTTTGLYPEHFGWSDPCPGGAGGGEDGRFFPIDGSHPRILTPQTQGLEAHWRHNMKVGTCHQLSETIEAARRALTPPLINSVKDSRYPHSGYNDGNVGFLRQEADLAIIFVTDQMDSSSGRSPHQFLEAFRAIKGAGRTKSLKIHAITIPSTWSGLPGCGGFSHERSDRIMYLVEETGGTWVNICGADNQTAWAAGMKAMSQGTFGFTSRFVPRGIPGDRTGDRRVTAADLEVRVDGDEIAPTDGGTTVWTYDPEVNAVTFSPLFIPPPGAVISIGYQIACGR